MRNRRLLFYLTRYPGWGGIETVTSLIIPELLKYGYEIDIISHLQQLEAQEISSGVTLYYMPDKDSFETEANRTFMMKLLEENHYDCIVYQDSYAPTENIIVEASILKKVPYIVFEHNTPLLLYKRKTLGKLNLMGIVRRMFYPIFRWKYLYEEKKRKRLLYDHCKYYVMLSKYYIPEIKNRLNIIEDENKFKYINNPLIINEKANCNIAKRDEVLFVGRLVKDKKVDKILRIWQKASSSLEGFRLTIVGDGPDRIKLEKLAKKLKLRDVYFEGYQNPCKYYERSKFFLMPSKYEGWGMTLVEAMSKGCIPLVEDNFSAVHDIITSGLDGVILPQNASIRKWNKEIRYLTNSLEKQRRMQDACKEKIKKFDIEKLVKYWIELIEN